VVRLLIEALNDPAPSVRRAAADALGFVGAVEALEPLRHLLVMAEDYVKRAAARALVHCNMRSAALSFFTGQARARDPDSRYNGFLGLRCLAALDPDQFMNPPRLRRRPTEAAIVQA
jgi:HEAT repeats